MNESILLRQKIRTLEQQLEKHKNLITKFQQVGIKLKNENQELKDKMESSQMKIKRHKLCKLKIKHKIYLQN